MVSPRIRLGAVADLGCVAGLPMTTSAIEI